MIHQPGGLVNFEAYKAARLKCVSPVTLIVELRTLKSLFSNALKWDLIRNSPFTNVKLLALAEQSPKYLTKREYAQHFDAIASPWLGEVLILAASTGLRRSKITNLRWQQVDTGRRIITVANNAEYQTKTMRQRMVPLNDAAASVLTRIPKVSTHVFTNSAGIKLKGGYPSQRFTAAMQ